MMDKLISEIKKIDHFSDADIELMISFLEEGFLPKGEHFLREGEVSHHIAYVVSGLTMHYRTYDGMEIPADLRGRTNAFCLGLGIYGSYRPFKNKNNFLKGFMVSPVSGSGLPCNQH